MKKDYAGQDDLPPRKRHASGCGSRVGKSHERGYSFQRHGRSLIHAGAYLIHEQGGSVLMKLVAIQVLLQVTLKQMLMITAYILVQTSAFHNG